MAPSVSETVSQVTDEIQEKIAPKSLPVQTETKEESAPAVQAPPVETQHKEPLKLSGALDHFESFDVTPVIGREFVGVNLAKWLKAPNSDELIRDLAITSMIPLICTTNQANHCFNSLPTWSCILPQAKRRYQRSAKGTCPASR
jgi:hypothetical protein